MRVEVRLYATLTEYVAYAKAGDPLEIELLPSPTLIDLLSRLNIPRGGVHLVIVNGRPVHDFEYQLQEDDRIGLFPPVGGG